MKWLLMMRYISLIILIGCLEGLSAANDRIVIVGDGGAVTSIGLDTQLFWQGLKGDQPAFLPTDFLNEDPEFSKVRLSPVPLSNDQLKSELRDCPYLIAEMSKNKDVDRQSLFALKASIEALSNANLFVADEFRKYSLRVPSKRIGALFGSTLGGALGSTASGPRLLKHYLPFASNNVARFLGLRGLSTNVAATCTSGVHAAILAYALLKAEINDVILAGGTDAQLSKEGLFARRPILSRKGTTELININDPKVVGGTARSFDREADGTVVGEGAGVLVLARESYARERKLPVKGYIAGFASEVGGEDATELKSDLIVSTIKDALTNAKIETKDISMIFAHAPGTALGDQQELEAIKEVFGLDALNIPIVSLASRIGHPLGPAGSLRMVALLKALNEGFIPGNLNLNKARVGFDYFNFPPPTGQRVNQPKYGLVLGFGFGGQYAAMIIGVD